LFGVLEFVVMFIERRHKGSFLLVDS
jgi:hypothetical protein